MEGMAVTSNTQPLEIDYNTLDIADEEITKLESETSALEVEFSDASSDAENLQNELENNEEMQESTEAEAEELQEKIDSGEGEPGDEEKLEELLEILEELKEEHEQLEIELDEALDRLGEAKQAMLDTGLNPSTADLIRSIHRDQLVVMVKSEAALIDILNVGDNSGDQVAQLEYPSDGAVGFNAVDAMALLQVLMTKVLRESSHIQKAADAVQNLIKAEKFAIGLVAAGHKHDAAVIRASQHFATAASTFITFRASNHYNKKKDAIESKKDNATITAPEQDRKPAGESLNVKVNKQEKAHTEKSSDANRAQTKDDSKKMNEKIASLDRDIEANQRSSEDIGSELSDVKTRSNKLQIDNDADLKAKGELEGQQESMGGQLTGLNRDIRSGQQNLDSQREQLDGKVSKRGELEAELTRLGGPEGPPPAENTELNDAAALQKKLQSEVSEFDEAIGQIGQFMAADNNRLGAAQTELRTLSDDVANTTRDLQSFNGLDDRIRQLESDPRVECECILTTPRAGSSTLPDAAALSSFKRNIEKQSPGGGIGQGDPSNIEPKVLAKIVSQANRNFGSAERRLNAAEAKYEKSLRGETAETPATLKIELDSARQEVANLGAEQKLLEACLVPGRHQNNPKIDMTKYDSFRISQSRPSQARGKPSLNLSDRTQELQELRNKKAGLPEAIARHNAALDRHENKAPSLSEEIGVLTGNVSQMGESIKTLRDQRDQLSPQLETAKNNFQRLSLEHSHKQEGVASRRSEIQSEMESLDAEIGVLRPAIKTGEKQLEETVKTRNLVGAESNRINKELSELDSRIEEREPELSSLTRQEGTLEAQKNALDKGGKSLREERAALSPKPASALLKRLQGTVRETGKKAMTVKAFQSPAPKSDALTPKSEAPEKPASVEVTSSTQQTKGPKGAEDARPNTDLESAMARNTFEMTEQLWGALQNVSQGATDLLVAQENYEAQLAETSQDDFRHTAKGLKKDIQELNEFYNTMLQSLDKVGQTQSQVTQDLFRQSKA